jgi:hypothetical protein
MKYMFEGMRKTAVVAYFKVFCSGGQAKVSCRWSALRTRIGRKYFVYEADVTRFNRICSQILIYLGQSSLVEIKMCCHY